MQLMLLMQQHFAQLLHLPEANFSYQKDNNAFYRIVFATSRYRSFQLPTKNSNSNQANKKHYAQKNEVDKQ
jgi:hypothetical protein